MTRDIRVNRSLTIPGGEIRMTFSTSSGPGGQHANRSATRADLTWNIAASQAVGPRQRERIRSHLGRRIDASGNLRISSDRFRSQTRNREDVLDRLARIVAEALKPRRARVATAPSAAARERRLQDKRRRSQIKQFRRASRDD
jgi:ribosome-associated protein